MSGYGKLHYHDGAVAYQGYWKKDEFSGQGTVYNDESGVSTIPLDYTNFDTIGENWVKYEGHFTADKKHGKGVIYFSNGEEFEGYFVKDKAEGEGIFKKKDESTVKGLW